MLTCSAARCTSAAARLCSLLGEIPLESGSPQRSADAPPDAGSSSSPNLLAPGSADVGRRAAPEDAAGPLVVLLELWGRSARDAVAGRGGSGPWDMPGIEGFRSLGFRAWGSGFRAEGRGGGAGRYPLGHA